ncbi:Uncharacterised protein [Haploplasma axanthum]|uniref:Uncharacterized protein n=1 Tax=Haploplasma axanthum TaxID=29552 RepID=A0A449BCP0_HAPAX|nr:Uncharacterised protein [Haploplasma axanthum]
MKKVFLLFFASVVFIFCSGFTVPNHLLENGTAY